MAGIAFLKRNCLLENPVLNEQQDIDHSAFEKAQSSHKDVEPFKFTKPSHRDRFNFKFCMEWAIFHVSG
jgi:hypothetical protein